MRGGRGLQGQRAWVPTKLRALTSMKSDRYAGGQSYVQLVPAKHGERVP